jgi:hypothetical protein
MERLALLRHPRTQPERTMKGPSRIPAPSPTLRNLYPQVERAGLDMELNSLDAQREFP